MPDNNPTMQFSMGHSKSEWDYYPLHHHCVSLFLQLQTSCWIISKNPHDHFMALILYGLDKQRAPQWLEPPPPPGLICDSG